MGINTSAGTLYNQYQSLITRFKSGEIDYKEALDEHRTLSPQTREMIGTGAISGPLSSSPVLVTISSETLARIEAHLATGGDPGASDYRLATQTYEATTTGDTQSIENEGVTLSFNRRIDPGAAVSLADKMIPRDGDINPTFHDFDRTIRRSYNDEAAVPLKAYALEHKNEWMSAANELHIPVSDYMFQSSVFQHISNIPVTSWNNITLDEPNSEAERIFRHIANPQEIAQFDAQMAPQKQEFEALKEALKEERIMRQIEGLTSALASVAESLMNFANKREALETAGLTAEDMNGVMLNRSEDGIYTVTSQTDKAAAIETAINNNPELRAMYEARWHRT